MGYELYLSKAALKMEQDFQGDSGGRQRSELIHISVNSPENDPKTDKWIVEKRP